MFTVKLAGVNILINSVFPQTEMAFVDFITNEKSDYCLDVTTQRINSERVLLRSVYPKKKFKDYEIEINVLYRDIPKILIREKVILFHGVLISMEKALSLRHLQEQAKALTLDNGLRYLEIK